MPRDRDVAELLLAQHRHLRPSLIALDKQAAEVLFGAETDAAVQNLRDRIGSVHRQLEEHFAVEEALFETCVSADEWGAFRLQELQSSHDRNRALLAALRADPPRLAPRSLARIASALAGQVLGQMVDEERELAAVGVLDDRDSTPAPPALAV